MSTFKQSETTENAIEGTSVDGRGLIGRSTKNYGIRATSVESAGMRGSSEKGRGVEGWATNSEGVVGISASGNGVWGQTEGAGVGVLGTSKSGTGVAGQSTNGRGMEGTSQTDYGVHGYSHKSAGVRGSSDEGRGVEGWASNSEGVVGISASGNGVWGQTEGAGTGVVGTSKAGVGIYAKGGRLAAYFEGDIQLTGDLCCVNADCAEDFNVSEGESIEPGTVMVLGEEECLRPSNQAYDTRVAGVVSGAGTYKPGIILDRHASQSRRLPVALLGKVYCKVDAQLGAIGVGDLLTTSSTPGHAMKTTDPLKAFGAVLGKALRPLSEGRGLIPILIALQ